MQNTGGAIRGVIGRWLMRIEATKGILQLVGISVTAVSTLTSALVAVGFGNLAPYFLAAGLIGTPAFAYAYVELGLFNRKNRERMDRGDNYAAPGMAMGQLLQARQHGIIAEAVVNDYDEDTIHERMEEETVGMLSDFRNGIDLKAIYEHQDASALPRPRTAKMADGGDTEGDE